ncbi:MAG: porin [Sutterella wadsworthensis]|nr:porin [Sutterella wadsworthensis]
MFKKSLAAVAVLGAFAGTALAADVQLYGIVDYGFQYSEKDNGIDKATHTFEMKSGMNSVSRFGLKGVEDLGNGYKVGFVLENGFNADDGTLNSDGRLFDREALLFVDGAWGQVGFGRVGQLASGNGTYGLFGGSVSPFSTGWGGVLGHKAVMAGEFGRLDNTVVYKSPKFAGVNVLAQYSFKKDNKFDKYIDSAREGSAEVDREYALGATFGAGNLNLVGVVTKTNVASASTDKYDSKDPLTVSFGGNYDFGVAKLFVATQYFKDSALNVEALQNTKTTKHQGVTFDGYGLQVGVNVPVFGGNAKAALGYMDGEDQTDAKKDMSRVNFSVGYDYPLSKRTFIYTGAGYMQDDYDVKVNGADDSAHTWAVNAGLVHKF